MLAHESDALDVIHQARKVDQVRCSHDGGSSSRKPVGYSRLSHHTRYPPMPPLGSTTPESDKSLDRKRPSNRAARTCQPNRSAA
jgi:hypothetical protein